VEISAPPIQPRRWRTATLVVAGLAAFLLLLFLIVFGGAFSKTSSADAKSAATKKHAVGRSEPKRARLSRAKTKILVLNANGISGAAAAESDRLLARGYKVSGTGNAAQTSGQSVVLYRPGRLAEAKRLAADEGIPLVGPLDGLTLRDLHGAHLAIVLGN
jgi:hypothetical protein